MTIDRLGNQIETVYNVDSNPVMERVSNGMGEWRINRTWKYDSLGNLIQSYGGGITYQYIHRPDGKLIKKSTQGRTLFTCTYHPDGNLRTLTDFTGTTMFYTYDLTGNLKSIVAGDGTELIRYHYTPGGKIQEILHHNGVQTAYSYDSEGNISGLVTKARAGKLLCDLHYYEDVTYGQARGYEQYYIETYETKTGVRGEPISSENRGNKINSYDHNSLTRHEDRQEYFEDAYKSKKDKNGESVGSEKCP